MEQLSDEELRKISAAYGKLARGKHGTEEDERAHDEITEMIRAAEADARDDGKKNGKRGSTKQEEKAPS